MYTKELNTAIDNYNVILNFSIFLQLSLEICDI